VTNFSLIAPARSPPRAISEQQPADSEGVFLAFSEREFDQTANLAAGVDADQIQDLEFYQTLGVKTALYKWHIRRRWVGGVVPARPGDGEC